MLEIRANGLKFACVEQGSGPLVLLLHGFPDTPQTWDATRAALAQQGFRAVSPFMRGYAPTEVPRDGAYDIDTLARDALALIEALGEQSAIVVGHDWGAAAAYAAAALQPERVSKLITVALPHPASVKPSLRALFMMRHMFYLRLPGSTARLRNSNFRYFDVLLRRWSPAWRVPEGETDAVKRALREPGSVEAAVAYYRALGPRPTLGLRTKIRVPTVAFSGTSDVVPPVAYERARSRFTGGYEVLALPGGHFLHREHPEQFTNALLRLLR